MGIRVRPVRPAEHAQAGEVTALAYREFVRPGEAAWDEYLQRLADVAGRSRRAVVLVAVEDGRILGTATLELAERLGDEDRPLDPGEAHLRMLAVRPDARRRGIGRLLMEAAIERARREGKTVLTLNTTRRMRVAQALYGAMGFERGPDRVFPDGFVLISYSLPLRPGEGEGVGG